MKALILAAGFGTRLERSLADYTGPHLPELRRWVGGKPKGLVTIRVQNQERSIVDYQVTQFITVGISLGQIYVQTNAVHYPLFVEWATTTGIPRENVISNQVRRNEDRLGPLADLKYALDHHVGYTEPLLVVAQDTLVLDEKGNVADLTRMVRGYEADGCPRVVVYEGEPSRLSRHGIVEVDGDVVVGFEEKPAHPKSNVVNASIHVYSPAVLEMIPGIVVGLIAREGRNIIEFIYSQHTTKVERVHQRIDVGTIQDVLLQNVGEGS